MPKVFSQTVIGDTRDKQTIDIFRLSNTEHYMFFSTDETMRGIAKIHNLEEIPTAAYIGAYAGIWVCYSADYRANDSIYHRIV